MDWYCCIINSSGIRQKFLLRVVFRVRGFLFPLLHPQTNLKSKKKMLKNLVSLATTCTILLIPSVCESFGYSWRKQFITCKTLRIKMLNLQIQALASSENKKIKAIKAISHQLFYACHGRWQFKLQNHGLLLHQKKNHREKLGIRSETQLLQSTCIYPVPFSGKKYKL